MLNETMLSKEKKYVIGVSGGPDSMALLDMLRKKGYQMIVCLVNYHKRLDSDLDYEVVKDYCIQHQIPLAYKEIFHYEKGNFQAQAREMRYDFYEEIAKLHQCEGVILAHHFDDYLETVLMQKERGQLDGLWGIQEISKYHQLNVYRPAMNYTKADLQTYCEKNSISYRIDSSNLESDYTRNYFRNNVLNNYNESQKQALYNEALNHNLNYRKLEESAKKWLNNYVFEGKFLLENLQKEEDCFHLLKAYLLQETTIPSSRISKKMIENALSSIQNKSGNVRVNLPCDFVLVKEYEYVYVTKLSKEEEYNILIKDLSCHDYGFFKISHEGNDRCGITPKEDDFPITIRCPKSGDYMELSYGTKKVSRLFIDAKIPAHLRKNWPVVVNCKGEIILIPKIAKNKDYLLAKPTWFVIQLFH